MQRPCLKRQLWNLEGILYSTEEKGTPPDRQLLRPLSQALQISLLDPPSSPRPTPTELSFLPSTPPFPSLGWSLVDLPHSLPGGR